MRLFIFIINITSIMGGYGSVYMSERNVAMNRSSSNFSSLVYICCLLFVILGDGKACKHFMGYYCAPESISP